MKRLSEDATIILKLPLIRIEFFKCFEGDKQQQWVIFLQLQKASKYSQHGLDHTGVGEMIGKHRVQFVPEVPRGASPVSLSQGQTNHSIEILQKTYQLQLKPCRCLKVMTAQLRLMRYFRLLGKLYLNKASLFKMQPKNTV